MKHVPNNDKILFKDMTPDERSILANAWMEDKLEAFHDGIGWQSVGSTDCLSPRVTYRTKPKQLTIPWDVIKPEYKWAAMDDCCNVYLYKKKPGLTRSCFIGEWSYTTVLNIDTTGIDWRESLVQRPEGV